MTNGFIEVVRLGMENSLYHLDSNDNKLKQKSIAVFLFAVKYKYHIKSTHCGHDTSHTLDRVCGGVG